MGGNSMMYTAPAASMEMPEHHDSGDANCDMLVEECGTCTSLCAQCSGIMLISDKVTIPKPQDQQTIKSFIPELPPQLTSTLFKPPRA